MSRRVCLFLSHSIEEYDQLRLLHSLGYEVASIGGYIDPAHPHDPKRPALPEVPCVAEIKDAVDRQQRPDNLGCAQTHVPDAVLEWLGDDGVMIWHHYLEQRLFPQWDRLRDWSAGGSGRRIVWRTVGQSVEHNERLAAPYRADDVLEIVRYSPRERNIPGYAGEDALIRFWKDPEEWGGWTGEVEAVCNVTQDLVQRHPWTNAEFFLAATRDLPVVLIGSGSDAIGGSGVVSYDSMRAALRSARCYLYTGTQPASYTLGLIEALMTGVPVVSIGPSHMTIFPYGPDLFEGADLAPISSDDPVEARRQLLALLDQPELAVRFSQHQRHRAIQTFGREVVGAAWREFLGAP